MVEFSITPIGSGEHVSEQVARCTRLIRESGIKNELHAIKLAGLINESKENASLFRALNPFTLGGIAF